VIEWARLIADYLASANDAEIIRAAHELAEKIKG
jgi:hypothetical protein